MNISFHLRNNLIIRFSTKSNKHQPLMMFIVERYNRGFMFQSSIMSVRSLFRNICT